MTRILFAPLLALAFGVLGATDAAAGCDPKCAKGVTCRYDSTRDPEYWCENKSGKDIKGSLSRPAQMLTPDGTSGRSSDIMK